MHPSTIITIPQQYTRQCPCGAVPEYPHNMCRKCHAGMVWRRRKTGSPRRASRRRRSRQSRDNSRILTLNEPMFRTANSRGADF
jgi:hypothetical protein